jgi:predicted Fe-Mo cluster-binding NifX family protein
MKTIAISAAEKNLDTPVEAIFGRSRFFILVDPETMEWEALDNLPHLSSLKQVGALTAQSLIRRNVQTIVTGRCGSKALAELTSAGVQVIQEARGTVRQALAQLSRGEFGIAPAADVG